MSMKNVAFLIVFWLASLYQLSNIVSIAHKSYYCVASEGTITQIKKIVKRVFRIRRRMYCIDLHLLEMKKNKPHFEGSLP